MQRLHNVDDRSTPAAHRPGRSSPTITHSPRPGRDQDLWPAWTDLPIGLLVEMIVDADHDRVSTSKRGA